MYVREAPALLAHYRKAARFICRRHRTPHSDEGGTPTVRLSDQHSDDIQTIAGLEVLRDPCRQRQHEVQVEPYETPIDLIRDRLGLTGTKKSCDMQDFGACTVLPDGRPVSSCTLVAFEARNSPLLTIEGMAQGEILHPIQEALIACSGFQCGFWPPNMILAAKALLDENPHPTVGEITHYMRDNLCRCTGYKCIPKAVRRAAQRLASAGGG